MDLRRAARSWSGAVALALVGSLVAAPAWSQQQEQEQPGLEGVLKELLREGLESQLSGAGGKIGGVRVTEQAGATVVLQVTLEGVAQPANAQLACDVFDRAFRAIPGFVVEHEVITEGDSTVALHLTYAGGGTALSTSLRVSLVDAGTGNAMSHRRAPLIREWAGGEAGGSAVGGAAPSPWTQPPVAGAAAVEPAREPVTVEVLPEPVGDTPVGVVAALPSSGAGQAPRPTLATATLLRPTPVPRMEAVKPAPTPRPMITKPMVAVLLPHADLYAQASRASWSSPDGKLPFNGKSDDPRGFARGLGQARLSDGQSYDRVLQTHPSFRPGGHISGTFEVTVPAAAKRFTARAGFLPGATASDGVVVTVTVAGKRILSRVIRPAAGVVELEAELPAAALGTSTKVNLTVATGKTSTQDWFVWVAPAIR